MLIEIGQVIRKLRLQKGFGLNDFAKKIEVSPAYLSNLETGKTETVHLKVLEKLHEELNLLPIDNIELNSNDSEIEYRINRALNLLISLHNKNNKQAEYLLTTLELGLDIFNEENDRSNL